MTFTLETRDLTIRFGGHVAVNSVSCTFRPGELTAIVGPLISLVFLVITAGVADKTRPICAYPKIARYTGTGDPNQPSAWVCTDGLERFESDYAEELRNIRSDVKTGNLDNLPNGGFVSSRRR